MSDKTFVISILGAGYVGLTTAAILANSGYTVYLVEPNGERLKTIEGGKSFFFEEGIDALIAHGLKTKNLVPTDSYSKSVPASDFVFSCVGTPDNPDGSSNLQYVFAAAEESSKHMKEGTVYVQKSTVPVGTGAKVEQLFKQAGKNMPYVSNPEFLREGTAIADTLGFDRVVAGGSNKQAVEAVLTLYQNVEKCRDTLAQRAGVTFPKKQGSYIRTNRDSAELIKVTANAFLALKISFANSIAKLADQTGADIHEVMNAVGADRRIGRAFLNAGRGYGGGCFPKDVSGLIGSAAEHGVDLQIMTAAAEVNETMPGYIAHKLQTALGELTGKKIAVLGLAFKAGTSDSRRSPGVKLANMLDKNEAPVTVYDPQANHEAQQDLRENVAVCSSAAAATKDVDAVLIATDWPEFLNADLAELAARMQGRLFIDAVNAFDISQVEAAGLQYIGIGRN